MLDVPSVIVLLNVLLTPGLSYRVEDYKFDPHGVRDNEMGRVFLPNQPRLSRPKFLLVSVFRMREQI